MFSDTEPIAARVPFEYATQYRRDNPMLSVFRRLMRNDRGVTAIEYTLIAALISVAAIAAMGTVGTKVNGVLSNVASTMK